MKRLCTLLFAAVLAGLPLAAMAGTVNINSADAEQLAAALQGVGEQKARAIVAYREAHGPFDDADQLSRVQGIGAATVTANRDRIAVE